MSVGSHPLAPPPNRQWARDLALFVGLAVVATLYAWKPGHQTRELLGAVVAVMAVMIALLAPKFCIWVLALSVPLIPWGFLKGTAQYPSDLTAVLACLFVFALALSPSRPRPPVSLTIIDALVLTVWFLMMASFLLGHQSFALFEGESVLWIGPYFWGRLLGVSAENRRTIAKCFVIGGVVLAPLIWLESATGTNLFTHIDHGASASFAGSALELRAGVHRASSSFLHPIALAMFLATATLLGAGLAFDSTRRRDRLILFAATALNAADCVLTVSRTAWLVLAVALMVAMIALPLVAQRRAVLWTGLTAVLVLIVLARVGPASISAAIPLVGRTSVEQQQSATYRTQLLQVALNKNLLSPFGTRRNAFANAIVGNYASIDDEYLDLGNSFGYLAAGALALMLPAVLLVALRRRFPDALSAMYVATAAGLLAGIWTVAFITQQQVLIWIVLGVCSGLEATAVRGLIVPHKLRRPVVTVPEVTV